MNNKIIFFLCLIINIEQVLAFSNEFDHQNTATKVDDIEIKELSYLDESFDFISRKIYLISNLVDSFFSDREINDKKNKSHLRIWYEFSKDFSRAYNSCSVKNAESKMLQSSRLLLFHCVAETLLKGLNLLGITPPERM